MTMAFFMLCYTEDPCFVVLGVLWLFGTRYFILVQIMPAQQAGYVKGAQMNHRIWSVRSEWEPLSTMAMLSVDYQLCSDLGLALRKASPLPAGFFLQYV